MQGKLTLTLTLSQVQAKLSVAAGRDGRAAVALQLNTRLWTVAPREPGELALTLTLTLTLTLSQAVAAARARRARDPPQD